MPSSNLGILVLGYARPHLLQMVLESLARQGALATTHVWIDGTADRMELQARTRECADAVRLHPVAEIRTHRGHLGIEKLMLDALTEMNARYDHLIVLEDDCFPTRHAVRVFAEQLEAVAQNDAVFSVYGHPFLTPAEGASSTRFQGWGWATTRRKLTPILLRARELFLLSEQAYLDYTRRMLTPEIIARLDVTPGRNVCHVLTQFYSWDSCTALLTALGGMTHNRTSERVIFNCGLGGDSGHFPEKEHLRHPPFNMINPGEAWARF